MMPELICTHKTHNCRNLVSTQVWRVAAVAATVTSIFSFRIRLSLGYGLEFLTGTLALESGKLP
jgi:hypothetical protein